MNMLPAQKLYIASDLHLEFSGFKPPPASQKADVIILAGDIWLGDLGILWAREQWPDKPIIYVAGNHEFYGCERNQALSLLRQTADKHGVHFLEQDEVRIKGIRYLGCTLWTDFKLFGEEDRPSMMRVGQAILSDSRLINEGSGLFTPERSIELFQSSQSFLHDRLAEAYLGPTVIVTHHLPSRKSVAKRFIESPASACFASHLDHLLGYCELWIHGHTHDNFDYEHRGTRVVCNPRGYCSSRGTENPGFKPGLIYEIGKGFTRTDL